LEYNPENKKRITIIRKIIQFILEFFKIPNKNFREKKPSKKSGNNPKNQKRKNNQ
jgi:hypothetical protein